MFEGKNLSLKKIDNGIAELCFDAAGSINKLDIATVLEIKQVVDLLSADKSVTGLLISSGKNAFIVGADITFSLIF